MRPYDAAEVIAVVIPTLGRRGPLDRTLEALERQTIERDRYEIIVVADPAGTDVSDVVGGRARLLEGRAQNASGSRNVGWRAATAPIVLFLGDDILGAPDLLAEHLKWHDAETGGVLGHVRWARELRATPFMRWLERGVQSDYGAIEGAEAQWFHLYTTNVSLHRTALEAVGGFDEERFPFLYEDLDLGRRLHEAGGLRLRYNRDAVGEHLHEPKLEEWTERMVAVAHAERRFVEQLRGTPAYFHDRLAAAAAQPRASGRGRHLIRWVDPDTPLVGARAWASADLYYRQQLAPAFLAAWRGR